MTISYTTGDWDYETLGNHRVVLDVQQAGPAMRAVVPWRRRDAHPEQKRLLMFSEAGEPVRNISRQSISRETCDLIFEPVSGPGRYYLYPMPYTGTPQAYYPKIEYLGPEEGPESGWVESWQRGLAELPHAALVGIQAIDELHSFYPMEVPATRAETNALRAQAARRPFLLFLEDRKFPIRMTDDLPLRWVERGLDQPWRGLACRGEFYAFQIGVWACCQPLRQLGIEFGDLKNAQGAARIPAGALRCFNLAGVDWTGTAFQKEVDLAEGKIQALWCGVQVPENAASGLYRGEVRVTAAGDLAQTLEFALEISAAALPAAGDDEPWRHSRLRWLDSTLGLDGEVTRPFIPLSVKGSTVELLERRVSLGQDGLPQQITSTFTPQVTAIGEAGQDILSRAITFVVADADGSPLEWSVEPFQITQFYPMGPGAGIPGCRNTWSITTSPAGTSFASAMWR